MFAALLKLADKVAATLESESRDRGVEGVLVLLQHPTHIPERVRIARAHIPA
jgi:hypothetical protein